MKQPQIVALTGLAGAGKDTAAQHLADALQARGKRVATLAFADPIRHMLEALGVPMQYMHERHLKEVDVPGFGSSYRHMAQTLGTEWGRQCMSSSFWVEQMQRRIDMLDHQLKRTSDFALITDARFPNEAAWIKSRGGFIVDVVRPGTAPVREHESERHALQWDYQLQNDADLGNLRSRCGDLSNRLLAERALEA